MNVTGQVATRGIGYKRPLNLATKMRHDSSAFLAS